jgi:membrane protease YdiL (CAAX protease family)
MEAPPDETPRGPDAIGAAPLPEREAVPPPRRAPIGREVAFAGLWLTLFAALGGAALLVLKTRFSAGLGDEIVVLPGGLAFEAVALIVASVLATRRRGALRTLGIVRLEGRWIVASIGVAIGLVLTSELLLTLLRAAGSDDPTAELADLFETMSPAWFALNLVLGAALVPLAEEMFYRGLLFAWIEDWAGTAIGAVASAAFFAVSHVSVSAEYAAVIFLLGIALAWLYRAAGSLWASVIAHGVNNAAAFVLLWVGE